MQDIDLLRKIEAPSNMMYSRSFSIIHKTENQNDTISANHHYSMQACKHE